MTNEYILIQEKTEGMGQIAVNRSVVEHIVTQTVREDKHIFLAHKKAVNIENLNGHIEINIEVRVQYGQNVDKSCQMLQETLQQNLELMIDYKETTINLSVIGFRFN